MTFADQVAISIICLSGVLGALGYMRWVVRLFIGLAFGGAMLILLSCLGSSVPAVGGVSDFLNQGAIAPAMVQKADTIAREFGLALMGGEAEEPADPASNGR